MVRCLIDGNDMLADRALAMVHEPLVDALAVVEVQAWERAHFFLRFELITAHRTNRVINLAVLFRLVFVIAMLTDLVLERWERNDLRVRQTRPALGLHHSSPSRDR